MGKFVAGAMYQGRLIGDADSVIRLTVSKRTEKTITTSEGKSLRVALTHDGCEFVRPCGRYSMSPIIRADRQAVPA